MKTIKMNVSLTEQMKKEIIESEILKLTADYDLKHQALNKELDNEIEKMKEIINQITYINADVEVKLQPKKRGWSDNEIEKLKELHGLKKPSDIAKQLNKSYQTVINKINELNLKDKLLYKWTEDEITILVELYEKSLDEYEISTKMKIPVLDIQEKISALKAEGKQILKRVPLPVVKKQ